MDRCFGFACLQSGNAVSRSFSVYSVASLYVGLDRLGLALGGLAWLGRWRFVRLGHGGAARLGHGGAARLGHVGAARLGHVGDARLGHEGARLGRLGHVGLYTYILHVYLLTYLNIVFRVAVRCYSHFLPRSELLGTDAPHRNQLPNGLRSSP